MKIRQLQDGSTVVQNSFKAPNLSVESLQVYPPQVARREVLKKEFQRIERWSNVESFRAQAAAEQDQDIRLTLNALAENLLRGGSKEDFITLFNRLGVRR